MRGDGRRIPGNMLVSCAKRAGASVALIVCVVGWAGACIAEAQHPERAPTPQVAVTPAPEATGLAHRVGVVAERIWNHELYRDDNRHYVLTVKALCIAAVIFLCGVLASRRIARWVHRVAVRRANLDEHVAGSIQTILYYARLVLVAIFALDMMHVPLTAFALFGGALAIGVGFGAQNLISNFLSGLILLIERPIRLGDIIDIDGDRGRVVKIGARCSQVRLFTGGDVLLPNSRFLERKLLNWTLTNFEIQFSIKVGVPYGAPVREVTRLLLQAVHEQAAVLTRPEPLVVFSDFGPTALMFEALFWLEMKGDTDARRVSSDIRFRVEELLREPGIAMVAPPPEAPRPPGVPGS